MIIFILCSLGSGVRAGGASEGDAARLASPNSVVLASFDSDDGSVLQWGVVNDTVMGGRSTSQFSVNNGALHFTGKLNLNGGGFASIRSIPQRMNLGPFEGLKVRIRGDGRSYQMRLMTGRRSVAYRAEFETVADQWRDIILPFSDFVATWRGQRVQARPLDLRSIQSVGVMIADNLNGPFALEIDSIEAVGAR
ncbi:MAG: CIA30 family protein [Pseudomonadales bacterium]|nr:CIA30 family protein [Pseudomonadales bacterium]